MKIALPCHRFSLTEREIINRHGFMAFPQFIDNLFTWKNKASVKYLERHLNLYGLGLIDFAVAPDYQYQEMEKLRDKWKQIHWIFPLHKKHEDFSGFDWIGYPYVSDRRDYDLGTFLKLTEGKKRWYLGFWDESHAYELLDFDGFDTTIPESYSGKYGKLWLDWGKSEESPRNLPTLDIFEHNVIRFKAAVLKLLSSETMKPLRLSQMAEMNGQSKQRQE